MKTMIRKPTKVKVFKHEGTHESAKEIKKFLDSTGHLVVVNGTLISIHLIDTVLYLNPGKYLVIDEGNDYHVYDEESLKKHFDEMPEQAQAA